MRCARCWARQGGLYLYLSMSVIGSYAIRVYTSFYPVCFVLLFLSISVAMLLLRRNECTGYLCMQECVSSDRIVYLLIKCSLWADIDTDTNTNMRSQTNNLIHCEKTLTEKNVCFVQTLCAAQPNNYLSHIRCVRFRYLLPRMPTVCLLIKSARSHFELVCVSECLCMANHCGIPSRHDVCTVYRCCWQRKCTY